MTEMEGQIYDHSQEGEMYDAGNVNASTEIVKMRRKLIVDLVSEGEITNPEAAIIIVEKLQRERNKMEQDLHEEAEHEPKEIYGIARKYARRKEAYDRYLVGEPPSPVRYCIEEAQKHIDEGTLIMGYDVIKMEDKDVYNPDHPSTDPYVAKLAKEPRKYGARRLHKAAWEYRAAANWYTMAAKLARREDDQNDLTAPLPPQPEH